MRCVRCGTKKIANFSFCVKCKANFHTKLKYRSTRRDKFLFRLSTLLGSMFGLMLVTALLAGVYVIMARIHDTSMVAIEPVQFVQTRTMFNRSGVEATNSQVANHLMGSVEWVLREETSDPMFVDMAGVIGDVGDEDVAVVLTFSVRPVQGRGDYYFMRPVRLRIGDRVFAELAAFSFIEQLYVFYAEGFDSMLDYYLAHGFTDGIVDYFLRFGEVVGE